MNDITPVAAQASVDFNVDVNAALKDLSRLVSQRNDLIVTIENGTTLTPRVHWSLSHGGLRHRTGGDTLRPLDLGTPAPRADICGFAFHAQGEGCNALLQVELPGHCLNVMSATPVNKDNYLKARFTQRCASAQAERAQLDKLDKHHSGDGDLTLAVGDVAVRIWITNVSPAVCRIQLRDRSGRIHYRD